MARFPFVPGAGAKRIGNPVYWARADLQHGRYRRPSHAAVQRFNERWQRLQKIQNIVATDFVDGSASVQDSMTQKEYDKLQEYIEDCQEWADVIEREIDTAVNADLSRYATSIKKVALMAIKLCIKYGVYDDVFSVSYDARRKMILLNEEDFFFLG